MNPNMFTAVFHTPGTDQSYHVEVRLSDADFPEKATFGDLLRAGLNPSPPSERYSRKGSLQMTTLIYVLDLYVLRIAASVWLSTNPTDPNAASVRKALMATNSK